MKKKTLLEIAKEARYFRDEYAKNRSEKKSLSYSDWMTFTESGVKNSANAIRTDAVLGIYDAENQLNSKDAQPNEMVMGDERYKQFPKYKELHTLRDEVDALYDEQSTILQRQENRKNAEIEKQKKKNSPEQLKIEQQNAEKKIAQEEQSKKDIVRSAEINKRLNEIVKEKMPIARRLDAFSAEKKKQLESEGVKDFSGDILYKDFPELDQLHALRDEADELNKEQSDIGKRERERKADIEKEKAAEKKKASEKAQIKKDTQRLKEINTRLNVAIKDKLALGKEFDEFMDKQNKKNLEEKQQKAEQQKKDNINDYEEAEHNEFVSRVGLLCAAKDALGKRTWRDYLLHPFRSIGENMRYNEMRDLFLEEYDMDEKELDAVIKTVGNGEEANLNNVNSIEDDGTIVQGQEEPQREILIDPEEKEELKVDLDAEFSNEKSKIVSNSQPVVEDPTLKDPTIHS